jgi:hypothetical protein
LPVRQCCASVAHDGIDLADWPVRPALDLPQYARTSVMGRNAMLSMRSGEYGKAATLSHGWSARAYEAAEGRAVVPTMRTRIFNQGA